MASTAASTRPISASAYWSHSSRAPVVVALQVFHAIGTRIDVIQQRDQNTWMQSLVNPVVHLDQDKRWNHQRLRCLLHQFPAPSIGRIVSVKCGVSGPV